AAGAFFDAETGVDRIRLVAEPRRRFSDEVHGRANAEPSAEADDERVVVVDQLAWVRVGVVDPDRVCVQRAVTSDGPRDDGANRRGIAVAEVIGAFGGGDEVHSHRARPLTDQMLLQEELDRPIAGAVNPDLRAGHEPEAVFEPDLRARIEAEEIPGEIAEIALAQRPREPVSDAERAAEPRNL